jgi:hypothetical protein
MAKRGYDGIRATQSAQSGVRNTTEEYICSCSTCLVEGNQVDDPVMGVVRGKSVGRNELLRHRRLEAANRRAEQLQPRVHADTQGKTLQYTL